MKKERDSQLSFKPQRILGILSMTGETLVDISQSLVDTFDIPQTVDGNVVLHHVSSLIAKSDRERFREFLSKLDSTTSIHQLEHVNLERDENNIKKLNIIGWSANASQEISKNLVFLDITEQAQSEKALKKSIKARDLLIEANRVLLKARNETEFLQEICNLAVEIGGYDFAWIGVAVNNQEKEVLPVASAGFEDQHLSRIKIRWDDSKLGDEPTGTAIRTRKPVCINDTHSGESFNPWGQEAAKRGYRSSVSLPLGLEEQPFGALSVYSSSPDAFDEFEIDVLMELAEDLSYGLTFLKHQMERKRKLDAIKESEERFRIFFRDAPEYCYMITSEGKILDVNNAALEIHGYELDELIGQSIKKIYAPECRKKIERLMHQLSTIKTVQNEKVIIQSKTGEKHQVLLSINELEDDRNNIFSSILIQRDITEIKKISDALSQSVERLDTNLKSMNDMVVLFDDKNNILFLHIPESFDFDKPVEYYMNREVTHLFPPVASARIIEELAALRNMDVPRIFDFSLDVAGQIRWYSCSLSWFRNKAEIVGVIRDITERIRNEIFANTSAQAALFYLDLLSHDIRNYLQAVTLGIDSIQLTNLELSEDPMIKIICNSVDKAIDLIKKANSVTLQISTELEVISLTQIVLQCLQDIKDEYPDVEMDCSFDYTDRLVIADTFLHHVFTNILENAIIHNLKPDKRIWVTIIDSSEGYLISIGDNGPGIPEAMRENFLNPSNRLRGVGFPQVILLLQKYGGAIKIKDRLSGNPDAGAEIQIWLPRAEEKSL